MAAILTCSSVLAQDERQPVPLVLTDEQDSYPLGLFLELLEDSSGDLTIEEVSSADYDQRFTPSKVEVPNLGYTSSAYWARLLLRNNSSQTTTWLLEVNFPNTHYVDLYASQEGGEGFSLKQAGLLRPMEMRDVLYPESLFTLKVPSGSEQTFYLRFENGAAMNLPLTLWRPAAFNIKSMQQQALIGLFFGALVIMLVYNLFLLLALRDPSYLYFSLFLASFILMQASSGGLIEAYLWSGFYTYNLVVQVASFGSMLFSVTMFADHFLETNQRMPKLHQYLRVAAAIWLGLVLLGFFVDYGIMYRLDFVLAIGTLLLVVTAGVVSWRRGFQPALYFLLAWFGFLFSIIITMLSRLGYLPSNSFTDLGYRLGAVWLVAFWSFALAHRINLLKTSADLASRRLANSEAKLSQTLDGLPIGVVVYDPEQKPTYINRRAIDILSNPVRKIRPDISARRTLSEAVDYFSFRVAGSDDQYPVDRIPVAQALDGKSTSVDDIEADLVDRRVPLEIWANPVLDENGKVESVVAAFQDITQRRQAQAELDAYRLQLEQLVNQRTAELAASNEQLSAENAERQRLEELLRLRLEWVDAVNQINQTIVDTRDLPPAYQKFTRVIRQLLHTNDAFLAEIDAQGKEIVLLSHTCQQSTHGILAGLILPLQYEKLAEWRFEPGKPIAFSPNQFKDQVSPISFHYKHTESQFFFIVPQRFGDTRIGLLGLEFPEAERSISPAELTLIERILQDIAQVREKAQVSEQSQEIIAVEERNRLARDLHDSVTQVLFSASLVAEVLPKIWQRDPEQALQSLEELRHLTHGALAEMRTMLLELRPTAITRTPLEDLLAQLTEAITSRNRLPFQLYIERIPPLPEEVHTGFYRIAQESLNNVVKHAQARLVSVTLSAAPDRSNPGEAWQGTVSMAIRDDGCGFDPQSRGAEHLGLGIMQERAALIGATLTINSRPGEGAEVTLVWQNDTRIAP